MATLAYINTQRQLGEAERSKGTLEAPLLQWPLRAGVYPVSSVAALVCLMPRGFSDPQPYSRPSSTSSSSAENEKYPLRLAERSDFDYF